MIELVKFEEEQRSEEDVFPYVPCRVTPLGNRIVVQLRMAKSRSKGGIALVQETKTTMKYNEVIAKVVALGPLAYRSATTLEPWPEGAWCQSGDYVRVIKWGGDRWSEPYGEDWVHFVIINDSEVIARIPTFADTCRMVSFVD